jgi:hypothetical protein
MLRSLNCSSFYPRSLRSLFLRFLLSLRTERACGQIYQVSPVSKDALLHQDPYKLVGTIRGTFARSWRLLCRSYKLLLIYVDLMQFQPVTM